MASIENFYIIELMLPKKALRNTLLGMILLGVLLRYLSAFLSLGASHPNEFYRLLEPIASADGYGTRLPWEWKEGLLSYLPIYAVRGLLHGVSRLGLTGAVSQLVFLKLIYASLSLSLIWATWRLLKKFSPGLELHGAAFVSLWPELIYQSVRIMDYSLEAAFFACAVGLTIGALTQKYRNWALAGGFLGVAFFVRYQTGLDLAAVSIAAVFLFQDRFKAFKYSLTLIISYGFVVLGLGILEQSLTHHPFLDPFFRYITFNWTEDGAARLYGVAPWHRYWSESAKYFGVFPFIFFALGALWVSFRRRANLPMLVLFFFPFLVYSALSHKEGRFAYGFLWLLIPLGFSALSRIFPQWRWPQSRSLIVFAALMILGWGINLARTAAVYMRGSEAVREWAIQSETQSRDLKISAKIIEGDPDFLPGGFFLRYRGPLCYRFVREAQNVQEGECP